MGKRNLRNNTSIMWLMHKLNQGKKMKGRIKLLHLAEVIKQAIRPKLTFLDQLPTLTTHLITLLNKWFAYLFLKFSPSYIMYWLVWTSSKTIFTEPSQWEYSNMLPPNFNQMKSLWNSNNHTRSWLFNVIKLCKLKDFYPFPLFFSILSEA